MKERTEEMERAALLRRLRRAGVHEIGWANGKDGLRLRAKLQVGRAHRRLETKAHRDQSVALEELEALVAAAGVERRPRRGPKPKGKRIARPGSDEPSGEVDDRPMAEQLADPQRDGFLRHEHGISPARAAAMERAAAKAREAAHGHRERRQGGRGR